MMHISSIETGVVLAGVGQLILVVASAVIPRCLDWKGPLAVLPLLMRQLFWTYAAYISGNASILWPDLCVWHASPA
jgi:hypothetical protein